MYRPWKFLVYIAADNTLYRNAQVSLREITDASLFSDVAILVQIDGPGSDSSSRYRCARGTKRLIWEAGNDYTADRSVRLKDFLTASIEHSHANERIFLVLWGEGAGLDHVYQYGDTSSDSPAGTQQAAVAPASRPKFAPDEILNSGDANRYVKDVDLASILLEFSREIGRKIDVLGFDACLMALAEVCCEVRQSVSLIVGSDEEIPTESWPYGLILQDLSKFPGMDANALCTLIVSRFVEKYSGGSLEHRASLSAIQLSESGDLVSAMKKLVDAINLEALTQDKTGASKRRIFRARDASRSADETAYIDFGIFCQELTQSFAEKSEVYKSATELLFVLKKESFILYHRDTGEDGSFDAYGLSLYFPETLPPDAAALEVKTPNVKTFYALDPPHGEKDPPHGEKDPPHGEKDPPHGEKDPPHGEKDPPHGEKDPPHGEKDPPHGEKDPPHGEKDPPHGEKDPPHGEKDPPHGEKFPGTMTIQSYEILWDSYVKLSFNRETGWADLLERLLK